MPVRSPAFRRRTGPRCTGKASNVGIWVTDAVLLQAIEQYQLAVAKSCRRISSHAGPLESRRRAAKRHMTGALPTTHPFPSIWQFDVPPTTVQWEAPTTQEYRRNKRDQISVSSMVNRFVGWLESSLSATGPSISLPKAESLTGTVFTEALAVNSVAETVVVPNSILEEPDPLAYLPEEIIAFRSSICNFKMVDVGTLNNLTKTCRQSFRRRIMRGDMSVNTMLAALDPLDSAAEARLPSTETANKIRATIRRSILYALVDAQKQSPGSVAHDLWLAFLGRICADGGSENHHVQLFWSIMNVLPSSVKELIPMGQIHNLTSTFVAAQANRPSRFANWSLRAARFGRSLASLNTEQRRELDDSMRMFLLEQDCAPETIKRMRFAWLAITAHDANVTTGEFIRNFYACIGKFTQLQGQQLWRILMSRLSAIGALDDEATKQLAESPYISMDQRWTALVTYIMAFGNKDVGLREMCDVLSRIRHFDTVVRSLTANPSRNSERHILPALASACDNHRQALEIFDSIPRRQPHFRRPNWSWTLWAKYMEQMIKDPKIRPIRVWHVLNCDHWYNSNNRATPEETRAKTQLLEKMALWFLEAPHLNSRQILRNIGKCISHQGTLTNGVSSPMLAHLAHHLSRDLEVGGTGNTARMEWLLTMVSQYHGVDEAKRAAEALNGWRAQTGWEGPDKL
ncbi:hypothetical protein VFPPC_00600 [Pochonia chlamydosporia 170]|uniref:Uncharacterized protein n=1 Tax=Pochonia chlamydosporia 170 TaxID=1380566 RepID=A0A179G4B9_METCM|nr:hypothetical protein VFPPC_00600 [Pochonia chlamydosporia 170]OAQ72695.1 hypothetical protein VFPPC_00600 [Pochonia chlamydosporia 170]